MDNYHYIIAGLPDLMLNSENKGFDYDRIKDEIYRQCSPADRRWIDWMEFGSREKNLNSHFYCSAISQKNKFISRYFELDLEIRNLKVDYLSRKDKNDKAAQYVKNPGGDNPSGKYKILSYRESGLESSDLEKLRTIFDTSNVLEKEQMLDKFKWDKINEFTTFDYFNINTILAFLAKGKLIDRWNKLDKQTGQEMFRKLVEEVRGTFKGFKEEDSAQDGSQKE